MDFEPNVKEDAPETPVTKYFCRGKQNRGIAKCSKCSKIIKCEGSSTSGMKEHLQAGHDITLEKPASHYGPDNQVASSSSNPKKMATLHQFFFMIDPTWYCFG